MLHTAAASLPPTAATCTTDPWPVPSRLDRSGPAPAHVLACYAVPLSKQHHADPPVTQQTSRRRIRRHCVTHRTCIGVCSRRLYSVHTRRHERNGSLSTSFSTAFFICEHLYPTSYIYGSMLASCAAAFAVYGPAEDVVSLPTGEGMDKSTLVQTQIQIIIIHFLPFPFPHIPNG
jgi:hypothetical protein